MELGLCLVRPAAGSAVLFVDVLLALALAVGLGALSGLLARLLWRRAPVTVALVPLAALLAPQLLRPFDLDYVWDPVLSGILVLLAWLLPRALGTLSAAALLAVPVAVSLGLDRGIGEIERVERADPAAPDVLLITVDTLRADTELELPATGGWLVYEQAVSASPWTLPAMISIFSGRPVREHLGGLPAERGAGYTVPRGSEGWLPSRFAERGYETAAFTSNPYLSRAFGFDRGFHLFVHADAFREPFLVRRAWERLALQLTGRLERLRRERDERVVRAAQAWLAEENEGPRFTWVHLLAPHEYPRDVAEPVPDWSPYTENPEALRGAYAANVRATQARVERLVEAVDPTLTLIVFTADHGEQLGETGVFGHGLELGDRELRVPLAVMGPGVETGTVHEQVATADLAALLLGLVEHGGAELPIHDELAVGGLRRRGRGQAFAERIADGGGEYTDDHGAERALERSEVLVPDADTRRALQALGYVE